MQNLGQVTQTALFILNIPKAPHTTKEKSRKGTEKGTWH